VDLENSRPEVVYMTCILIESRPTIRWEIRNVYERAKVVLVTSRWRK